MNAYTLHLCSASAMREIDNVTAFVGEDDSGSFSIWAGHERMTTVLNIGLARYRDAAEHWHYLALPGAVLHFADNVLNLSTRHFWMDDDYQRITATLKEQLVREEVSLSRVKDSLRHMEDELLRRMVEAEQ